MAEAEGGTAEGAVRSVLTGGVARAVIRGALSALPGSLPLRERLLTVLCPFQFPGVERLSGAVCASLESDFPADAAAWDLRARQHWPGGPVTDAPSLPPATGVEADSEEGGAAPAVDLEGHSACCAVYEAAVVAAPTASMWGRYAAYLGQRVRPALAAAHSGGPAAAYGVEVLISVGAELLAVHARAAEGGHAGVQPLVEAHVGWALALGQPRVALRAARRACEVAPSAAGLWQLRMVLELQLHAARQVCDGLEGEGLMAGDEGECAAAQCSAVVSGGLAEAGLCLWN